MHLDFRFKEISWVESLKDFEYTSKGFNVPKSYHLWYDDWKIKYVVIFMENYYV